MKMTYTFLLGTLLIAGLTACDNEPEQLSWSFTGQENYTYSYAAREEIITTGENFTGTALYQTMGDMVIRSLEKGTASIVLQNGKRTTYTPDTDGSILDSFTTSAEWKIDLMNPDGSIKRQDHNSSIPLELLLGLPHTIPREEQEMEQPLNLIIYDGKELYKMEGKGLYKFMGYQEINGYNCVEISGRLIFDYTNDNERQKIKINTTADVHYYFAVKQHCLVQGSIDLSQKVTPMPEENKISLYWSNTKEEVSNIHLTLTLKGED